MGGCFTGTESVTGWVIHGAWDKTGVTVLAGFSDSSCFHFASSSSFSAIVPVRMTAFKYSLYILAVPSQDLHVPVRRLAFSLFPELLRATVELSILMISVEGYKFCCKYAKSGIA